MLMLVVVLIIELLVIFLISKRLIDRLGQLFFKLTRNHQLAMHLLATVFLPGTIFHELSHLIIAGILMVPVGDLVVFPEIEGEKIKLGSVQIAKTDPLRRILIGVAPLILGLALISGLIFFNKDALSQLSPVWLVILVIYLVFQITNTMFSSKQDLEGALIFVLTIAIVLLIIWAGLYFSGHLPNLSFLSSLDYKPVENFLATVDKLMLAPLLLDLVAFGVLSLL